MQRAALALQQRQPPFALRGCRLGAHRRDPLVEGAERCAGHVGVEPVERRRQRSHTLGERVHRGPDVGDHLALDGTQRAVTMSRIIRRSAAARRTASPCGPAEHVGRRQLRRELIRRRWQRLDHGAAREPAGCTGGKGGSSRAARSLRANPLS